MTGRSTLMGVSRVRKTVEIGDRALREDLRGGKWSSGRGDVSQDSHCYATRTGTSTGFPEYPQMSLENPQRRRVVHTMEKEWHGSRNGTNGTAVALLMEAWWQ
ncbi:hypothetical protein GCM10022419_040690 [Nonomuraea rosea]|uniref:Uncharacterized protein n=1 Tax=Nonomuraea rosea TaxID=638574 RepID=A0ABP6WX44_9ACTN